MAKIVDFKHKTPKTLKKSDQDKVVLFSFSAVTEDLGNGQIGTNMMLHVTNRLGEEFKQIVKEKAPEIIEAMQSILTEYDEGTKNDPAN